ncbi:hypothetical protein [Bifidobacterium sp. UTBIF-78]|uniref:hypothetical protein n=1 Tax=Bifidobacterium sp. UTBIF-78 TaxID=1465263 RepID=UPI00112B9C37|nr:hypothetical protein [Bifidobacterium sp. UTBIF-78]TPF93653.1 hypothetical protein BG22_06900 [Bifidobacterium sp. UTBIF-78]
MTTNKPHIPTSNDTTDPTAIDRTAATNLLAQLQQDREVNADRIMAPKWYYAISGLIAMIVCLTFSDFVSEMGFHSDASGWWIGASLPSADIMEIILLLVASYVGLQVNAWRARQIGSDFDTFGGLIAPRNAAMWAMAVALYALSLLGLVLILLGGLGLQWLPDQTSVITLAMGALGWFGEYGYDRYCARLVKRGDYVI